MQMNEKTESKVKKIAGTALNVILWVFVILCIAVTVVAVSASNNSKGIPSVAGKSFLSVLTGSMNAAKPEWVPEGKPSGFAPGTMIVSDYIADDAKAIDALEVGDIITFEWDMDGDARIMPGEYNTHRIKEIARDASGSLVRVVTQGDNPEYSHGNTETVDRSAILARYTGTKMAGVGNVMKFLSTQLGFGLCVLLPIVLFFLYELAVFILTLVKVRNADKKIITAEDEEMIRRKAVEEYLRQQAEAKAQGDGNDTAAGGEDASGTDAGDGKDDK